ncbi:hypothetical protein SDC9_08030 [bioreactor metagenome]|uniref:Uncharacterized protein n=1 Tax=bioreactor metagenome TaxID=1076179 RepID=A0A644T6C1_9ZZZZ|nr:hypothetical protein [Candidatus Elulimicrobiales bacterium]HPX52533.1 hypothetical protein [Candidatus Paceibacterota bacterium]HQB57228.1 hypothetical protein [Candidatus Paceibacterota bacterium]
MVEKIEKDLKDKLIKSAEENKPLFRDQLVYDCYLLFKILEKNKDVKVAEAFKDFLWQKYEFAKKTSPEGGIAEIVGIEASLLNVAEYFYLLADNDKSEESEKLLKNFRENALEFFESYGKF